jgi:hypothetical protein
MYILLISLQHITAQRNSLHGLLNLYIQSTITDLFSAVQFPQLVSLQLLVAQLAASATLCIAPSTICSLRSVLSSACSGEQCSGALCSTLRLLVCFLMHINLNY